MIILSKIMSFAGGKEERKFPRSPSRRRVSSIRKEHRENDPDEDPLSITPSEIDELIERWNTSREQSRELAKKEKKYRRLMEKIMDITGAQIIKGKELQVTRTTQNRRTISRADLPSDIFQQYSKLKTVDMYYIRECSK